MEEDKVWHLVKSFSSLIFLCFGSSFIGLLNHLSNHSAVLIGPPACKSDKKSIWNQDLNLHFIKCLPRLGGKRLAVIMMQTHLHTHSSLLHPSLSLPSFTSFSVFLTAFLSSSPVFTFPTFDIDLVKLSRLDWRLSNRGRINTVFFYVSKKKRRWKWTSEDRTSVCPDSHESPCWQREASWQPQPEVKAPISYS